MSKTGIALLITVDCEADDEWSRPLAPTYRGILALRELQALCDRFGAQPTYLVTYDVLEDPDSRDTLMSLIATSRCEVGAHLHAWRTPPFHPELDTYARAAPYLHEYPDDYRIAKLQCLTEHIIRVLDTRPRSYRGGRWSLDNTTLDELSRLQYAADTTVTPLMSWEPNRGAREGGVSYLDQPCEPYVIREESGGGKAGRLIEVPVTVRILGPLSAERYLRCAQWAGGSPFRWRLIRYGLWVTRLVRPIMMDPVSVSCMDLRWLVDQVCASETGVLNMAFHSSELVAGASPCVPNDRKARAVWDRLEDILQYAASNAALRFFTLSEFAEQWLLTVSNERR